MRMDYESEGINNPAHRGIGKTPMDMILVIQSQVERWEKTNLLFVNKHNSQTIPGQDHPTIALHF